MWGIMVKVRGEGSKKLTILKNVEKSPKNSARKNAFL